MRISSLIRKIADKVEQEFENKGAVGWKMNQGYDKKTRNINTSDYKD
jgi:hypothetical protein